MSLARFLTASLLLSACAEGSNMLDGGVDIDLGMGAESSVDEGRAAECGNGVVEEGEECDGVAPRNCIQEGFVGGTIACSADCRIDKSGCEEALCGNGTLDDGEECDGSDLRGESCESSGFAAGGTLSCDAECRLDTSECESCGNGRVDEGEDCDGDDLGGMACTGRGFTGGTLSCSSRCDFIESACENDTCGNGTIEAGEDCDGAALNDATCVELGFSGGDVSCSADCTFITSACTNCGDGRVDGFEACDGDDLAGQSCTTMGFTGGTLSCNAGCVFNASACVTTRCGNGTVESGEECDDGDTRDGDGCTACVVDEGWTCSGATSVCAPVCGDGMVVGAEPCDGANLNGATCETRGFVGGTLACNACAFDTAGCNNDVCGNGVINFGEACDDGNNLPFDGCAADCTVDPTFYMPLRLRGGEGSNHGRLEARFEGEWRDICDDVLPDDRQAMADVVCTSLGYTGTGHEFLLTFGGGTGSPLMDDIVCTGDEDDLSQCGFAGWNQHNCFAFEAVGFRCAPGEGDIRLVDGPSGMEGRLQVFTGGAWGEVCDDVIDGLRIGSLGYGPATVCGQLGYADGEFVGSYDSPTSDFALDDVNCTGTERRILDCPARTSGDDCFFTEGAGFRCSVYEEGDVRLVEAPARNRGRVEVLHDDVWGTVCDDFLTFAGSAQAGFVDTVCEQLGFSTEGSVLFLSDVPDGVDPIWLDDVMCDATDANLVACDDLGWGLNNCSHVEDVGLSCTP
ncbi:MAG: DUF4215 domain-containing protein [Myxococcota bacterium]